MPNRRDSLVAMLSGLLAATAAGSDAATIERRELLTATFGERVFDRIDMRAITLAPHQDTPRHYHPGGTVGVVTDGLIRFKAEGAQEQILRPGDAFSEAPNQMIERFANASDSAPASFLVCYPLHGEMPLIVNAP